ncbi:hypothetical protein SteCoe_12181 [Stentor coeruleus]|uniref:Exocyst subunit Exo70 family protein n=1 Tax=Stentor coeruleus TaxID=5963 RepID=A0A1R2CBJ2_9CILI|nr:hypothetical protein SteCoe_12181 [Stentor coeruleus]
MSKSLSIREDLQRKIRECSLSGSEVLRSLDKAVYKLEDFARIVQPLQEAANKLGEDYSSIDKTLDKVRDEAQTVRESYSLVKDLQSPSDSRSHLKSIERAQILISFFQKNPNMPDSRNLQEKLASALSLAYPVCIKLIEEQLIKYNEIYGVNTIAQDNTAQIDMVNMIKELIDICKIKAPNYWQVYVRLRSSLLLKYVISISKPEAKGPSNSGQGMQLGQDNTSKHLVNQIKSFVRVCEVEKEFLQWVLGTQTVQDWLGEVTEGAFQSVSSQTESFLSKKVPITMLLEVLKAFTNSLGDIENLLGKSVKYYTASKLQTTLLQKSQSWYREYIQVIQTTKMDFGDFVHDMSIQLSQELKKLMNHADVLAIAKLDQSILHLVTSLIDTFRIKIKVIANKQQGLSHVFMINNLSFWINVLQEYDFIGLEDVMTRVEKEMLNEINEYSKNTWSKLLPILSDNPTAIEMKKNGVLTRSSIKAIKNKFKSFNTIFPEIFNYHKNFSIYSRDILQLLRKKNYQIVVPAYKDFLKRYLAVDFTTKKEKYVLFPIETLEPNIMNMYSHRNIPSN